MSVQVILPALSYYQLTIPGILVAFPQNAATPLPDSLADLPAFINFPGPTQNNLFVDGADRWLETRRYRMLLYLLGYGEGIEREGELVARPYFTSVPQKFASIPSLGNIPGVQRVFPEADSGLTVLRYANTPYWGIEFTLRVEYHQRRIYAKGE